MEYRNDEEAVEQLARSEESKNEGDKVYFGCGNDSEEQDYSAQAQSKNGAVAPKPSDVRNGDLVSLLLAATPPYLYNIPLVPQTFFFSEMLKSFVQAKTERQNLKAHQTHHRRQRKRSWREATPPNQTSIDPRDKPLELTTTPKHPDDKPKSEKSPAKKLHPDGSDKKLPELGNFSVEKLANSSKPTGTEPGSVGANSGDVLPPAPPLWYPLLYPPHPPYGIDPLHFFIDLRVSAHFWDRTAKINNENGLESAPGSFHGDAPESALLVKGRHCSAFRVPSPSPRRDSGPSKERRGSSRSVHYVISSLKEIYRSVEREAQERRREGGGKEEEAEEEEEEEEEGKKCKEDLRALIGLELVVDYVKQESDGEEEKAETGVEEEEEEKEEEEEEKGYGPESVRTV